MKKEIIETNTKTTLDKGVAYKKVEQWGLDLDKFFNFKSGDVFEEQLKDVMLGLLYRELLQHPGRLNQEYLSMEWDIPHIIHQLKDIRDAREQLEENKDGYTWITYLNKTSEDWNDNEWTNTLLDEYINGHINTFKSIEITLRGKLIELQTQIHNLENVISKYE